MSNRGVAVGDQPFLERVGTEILVHDENRAAVGRESGEPEFEHRVEFGFSDLDRRVAPDEVESPIGIDLLRIEDLDVPNTQSFGVPSREVACSGVHVDSDHTSVRTST